MSSAPLPPSVSAGDSEALLEAICAHAPVGIAYLDREFRILRMNATLSGMNGLPPEAHLGRTCREVLPDLEWDAFEAVWRRVIETGRPVLGSERSGETPAAPGQLRSWSEDCYPVRVNGTITGVALIVRETTAEKRIEHLQRLLIGTVGHDLRNPLAVISLSASVLSRNTALAESHRRVAVRIEQSARRIEALARDLLDYTAIQRGGIPVSTRPASMKEIVESAVEEVQGANPEATIHLESDAEVRGSWDPERIRQVVANLLSNAIKYGHPGEPIHVRLREECDHAVVEVANRGEAIPPERLPFLFNGAWQGRPEARRGGIGLGLLIVREIVIAHSGAVDVRSATPEGTTVTVRLPRMPRTPPGSVETGEVTTAPRVAGPIQGPTTVAANSWAASRSGPPRPL